MKKLQANIYQLAIGKWKFGGVVIGDEKNPSFTECDSRESFDTEEKAKEAVKKYCIENGYKLLWS